MDLRASSEFSPGFLANYYLSIRGSLEDAPIVSASLPGYIDKPFLDELTVN